MCVSNWQVVASFLSADDVRNCSVVCSSWRAVFCQSVTQLSLPLSHPLLLAGPGQADLLAADDAGTSTHLAAQGAAGSSAAAAWQQQRPRGLHDIYGLPHPRQISLVKAFPNVKSLVLVHNTMLHRHQARAALQAVQALWPKVADLSIQDCVSWDFPLDYEALGSMKHLTSLGLLFQGQGGMDEAGQPAYRSGMKHLCGLSNLCSLTMKWIIGYDVDSFLDFEEVRGFAR